MDARTGRGRSAMTQEQIAQAMANRQPVGAPVPVPPTMHRAGSPEPPAAARSEPVSPVPAPQAQVPPEVLQAPKVQQLNAQIAKRQASGDHDMVQLLTQERDALVRRLSMGSRPPAQTAAASPVPAPNPGAPRSPEEVQRVAAQFGLDLKKFPQHKLALAIGQDPQVLRALQQTDEERKAVGKASAESSGKAQLDRLWEAYQALRAGKHTQPLEGMERRMAQAWIEHGSTFEDRADFDKRTAAWLHRSSQRKAREQIDKDKEPQ
jgi:hypothetical protein